jgi:hypothetical protein
VALYDGRDHLGSLVQEDYGTEAVLPDGESLGLFNDEADATRALIAARKGPAQCRKS